MPCACRRNILSSLSKPQNRLEIVRYIIRSLYPHGNRIIVSDIFLGQPPNFPPRFTALLPATSVLPSTKSVLSTVAAPADPNVSASTPSPNVGVPLSPETSKL